MSVFSKCFRSFARTCIVAMYALWISAVPVSAQTNQTIINFNEIAGDVFSCNSQGYCLFLNVWQVAANGSVFLTYEITTPVPSQSILGSGTIPSSDFGVTPKQKPLVLITDTGTNEAFTTEFCDSNTCTPYPGGLINLMFTPLGVRTTTTGTSVFEFPLVTNRIVGAFATQEALVSGTVDGIEFLAFDTLSADIVTAHGASMNHTLIH